MKRNYTILLAAGLIIITAAMRIFNAEMHIYNIWGVTALGLFSGAMVKDKRVAFLFTLLAQLSSDLYFEFFTTTPGFYGIEQIFTYASLMLVTLIGTKMGQPKALKVLGFTLAGSTIFFLLSNMGVWASIQFGRVDLYGYGKGLSGLAATCAAALPFYKSEVATQLFLNTYVGDIIFGGVLFGVYALVQQVIGKRELQKARTN